MHDKKILKKIDKYLAKIKKNPKLGKKILIEAGIITKTGRLTKRYR